MLNYYSIFLNFGGIYRILLPALLPGKYCTLVKLQKIAVKYIYRILLATLLPGKYCT